MSAWSILLRLVLSLGLVLNGTAWAMAPSHLQSFDVAQHRGQAMQTVAGTPCHGHHAMSGRAVADSAASADHVPTQPLPCCKSSACGCACAQAQVVVVPASLPLMPLAKEFAAHPSAPRHAAPVLPHLIRPPIG
ncbi:MAG: CopL family metal-binding regulatory protein [Lysobacter sp.]|nr:CopL family metal-binding regulatory protein [Lysobacter sp.]